MLSRIRNDKSLSRALWIAVALFALPAIAYAASIIIPSGDFLGLGDTSGRILFTERGAVDDISFLDCNVGIDGNVGITGNVGINLTAPAGERLHLGDGNFLIEGGGETAIKVKRDIIFTGGPSGISQYPIFELGRIIQAGDGDPEFRFLYSDDNTPERSVFEFDRKGIVASVKPERGSHFEGFIAITDTQPIFRLNSYPAMRLEMGNGGSTPVDVAIQRETTNTLTFITGTTETVRIDPNGVEVTNGYIKLDAISEPPPDSDCDAADEVGRMKVDSYNPVVYICTAFGWGKIPIMFTMNLPLIIRNYKSAN